MAKTKTIFNCTNCGASSGKWIGHCPSCDAWNTYQEEIVYKEPAHQIVRSAWKEKNEPNTKAIRLDEVVSGHMMRHPSGDAELDRLLGGGLVRGAVILLAGQPGIGKSTLLLQLALNYPGETVLYMSGEESEEQIKLRANRIQKDHSRCFLLAESRLDILLSEAVKVQASLLIIDSIQTLYSPDLDAAQGTISQIRLCAGELIKFAKDTGIPVFLIGHITKEGDIAGPKLLEHMVDVVLYFEGERHYAYRIIRSHKNRFGSTDELSLYEMHPEGLKAVQNPSELLLSQHEEQLSGSAIASTVEGLRPLLIETQALVGPAVYGNPQRIATGFDSKRLAMLLAILEKRCGFHLGQQDVFLNLAGGIRINDPALDLAVIAALISSIEDNPLHRQICFCGEVGLSGEIRSVSRIDIRIQEAERMGFKAICVSKYNFKPSFEKNKKIKIVPLATVNELYEKIFSK
ncbi:MAG: DNA repair protein RadA [Bacteroidota bacterium]|nr:DNA repair protein RadA [Bacteroidota bacterium]